MSGVQICKMVQMSCNPEDIMLKLNELRFTFSFAWGEFIG
jgi:hypothetical protein